MPEWWQSEEDLGRAQVKKRLFFNQKLGKQTRRRQNLAKLKLNVDRRAPGFSRPKKASG
jgi:hypothetical protein